MKNIAKSNPLCKTQQLYTNTTGWIIETRESRGKMWLTVRNENANVQVFEYPVKYSDGSIAYDRPEKLPLYIKKLVTRYYNTCFAVLRDNELNNIDGTDIEITNGVYYQFKEKQNGDNFQLLINGKYYPECRTAFDFVTLGI